MWCILLVLLMGLVCQPLVAAPHEDYPILFVHGHGGGVAVEDTWAAMADRLDGVYGYAYYGKVWEKSQLPQKLSPKNIFMVGFYRESAQAEFGNPVGKIGGIPLNLASSPHMLGTELTLHAAVNVMGPPLVGVWYSTRDVDYKADYFHSNRISYADRLAVVVDKVLAATGSKKVIIVAHSMGGLVARSYVRWGGGEAYVAKLLLVGVPNHGIANDNRAAFEMMANPHAKSQAGGEYLEMGARGSFGGRSFTAHLNQDWAAFCVSHGVRYATIAGNKDPYPLVDIGANSDGVIDRDSVFLKGAEFNGLTPACHIGNFGLPFVSELPDDENIVKSTYTREIIMRWIFHDVVQTGSVGIPNHMLLVSPFYDKLLFQYNANPDPVVAYFAVFDAAQNKVLEKWVPAYAGPHHVIVDTTGWSVGSYKGVAKLYDMNGLVLEQNLKTAGRVPGSGNLPATTPKILFVTTPEKYTSERSATLKVASDYASSFAYQLDGKPYTRHAAANSQISLENLTEGLHVLHVTGFGSSVNAQVPAIFRWVVGPEIHVMVQNQTLSGDRDIRAIEDIQTAGTVLVPEGATVKMTAGKEIRLKPGFKSEKGSRVTATIGGNNEN